MVAARLSEDPNVTVVVLEAGPANLDDPLISTCLIPDHIYRDVYLRSSAVPAQFGKHFGHHKYDWDFTTVPQKSANNAVYKWARGKMLGGSSAINFLVSFMFSIISRSIFMGDRAFKAWSGIAPADAAAELRKLTGFLGAFLWLARLIGRVHMGSDLRQFIMATSYLKHAS